MAPAIIPDTYGPIFSATYSGVPVYEYIFDNNQIMRRREDDWINATHILKVAEFDKPARTRILEREVQKGVHEKIQGGYGKYQGTWVPLADGRLLAERNKVLEKLRPIFDFVHNERDPTPPQAPKHTTAASNKPKVPKATATRRAPKSKPLPAPKIEDQYDNISSQLNDDDTPDNSTVVSESMIDEGDMIQRYSGSRKRKRAEPSGMMSKHDYQHSMYADALLDYFMLHNDDTTYLTLHPPTPPEDFEVNRSIDGQGHTALHWAAAMGEIEIVKDLILRGSDIEARNIRGETPLIRATLFANCFEKGSMPKMVFLLQDSIMIPDRFGGTILHHVAHTAQSCSKTTRARCYLNILLNKIAEKVSSHEFAAFVNTPDNHGDTAFHIAARFSRRCMRAFQSVGASDNIPNHNNETVSHYIELRAKAQKKGDRFMTSSSPIQPDGSLSNGRKVETTSNRNIFALPVDDVQTSSARSFSESFGMINDKANEVLQAVETEIKEKDNALAEAERLLQNAINERHVVRQQTYPLTAEIEDEDMKRMRVELENEKKEAEALAEQRQHSTLHSLVRTEENQALLRGNSNGGSSEDDIEVKVRVARDLHSEQEIRRQLTREVVQRLLEAGISEKGEELIRLVAKALTVEVGEVPGLLPEVLEHLEMGRMEGHGVGSREEIII